MACTKQTARIGTKRSYSSISLVNFQDPNEYHDLVIVIGETKFYVVSGVLSLWSKYFRLQFDGKSDEEQKKEIELKDVDADVFGEFLHLLYGSKFNSDIAKHVHTLVELSIRFEAPKILDCCKSFLHSNVSIWYPELSINPELLRTVCHYDTGDFKAVVVEFFKKYAYREVYGKSEILDIAIEYGLDDLKAKLASNMDFDLKAETCIGILDFAVANDMPELKERVIDVMSIWKDDEDASNAKHCYIDGEKKNESVIPEQMILPLTECAFKYDIEVLKELLNNRIFFFVETTGGHITELRDGKESRHEVTVNTFINANFDEISALPKEIKEFILQSSTSGLF